MYTSSMLSCTEGTRSRARRATATSQCELEDVPGRFGRNPLCTMRFGRHSLRATTASSGESVSNARQSATVSVRARVSLHRSSAPRAMAASRRSYCCKKRHQQVVVLGLHRQLRQLSDLIDGELRCHHSPTAWQHQCCRWSFLPMMCLGVRGCTLRLRDEHRACAQESARRGAAMRGDGRAFSVCSLPSFILI